MSYDKPEEEFNEMFNEERVTKRKSGYHKYFPSNTQQALIRNAVTGEKYEWLVGSAASAKLFKMVDTTGTCDTDGYVIKSRDSLPNHNPNHLYYDSPEQAMSNLNISLSSELIERWRTRNAAATEPINFD